MNRLQEIGTIATGTSGDFIVVDRDALSVSSEALRNTQILWVTFRGNTVFGSSAAVTAASTKLQR